MSSREKGSLIPIEIMPLEKAILADGSEKITGIIHSKTKEDEDAFKKVAEERGMRVEIGKSLSKEETKRMISEARLPGSFGIADWSHCKWNPTGPTPPWARQEKASGN